MLKAVIYQLGSEPKLSLKRFLIGLAFFAAAVAFIALGYYTLAWLQLIGLVLLLPALVMAAWGYLGIFANRFAQVLEKTDVDPSIFDKDKLK
ncbi:hypothetical protein ACFOEE_20220 [Pseudoalteromonas fenneropenaei]|uniref:Uncharacterized protein n=1 Tax=Pseudoalteromonas fenneropenaei TaxID=1737459 RepID=A0ABV7CQS1_9GAMM